MRRIAPLLIAAGLLLALAACYTVSTSEGEGELRRGEGLGYLGEILVMFEGVSQDSRCPRDVQCVWAGEAYADFTLTLTGGQPVDATIIITPGGQGSIGYGGYLVTLTALEPDPPPVGTDGEAIDYVAHITIEESDN